MQPEEMERFRQCVHDGHEWPCTYMFKFIVPSGELWRLEELFQGCSTSTRPSRNGKYTSLTAHVDMRCADEVMAVYHAAHKVPGIISL